ncbi:hypothetical protein [Nocardia tengchongensis]|uniref:hypothetical protein n=1 Tax=Nocardia tengchongensis TaxID=2055889 RepID=UPI00365E4778
MQVTLPTLTVNDFRDSREILIFPHAADVRPGGRSDFTVFWIDEGPEINRQNRIDDMDNYIHRVTRNSKRPFRLISG